MAHPTHEIRDLKRRMDALEAENAKLRGRLPPEPEKPTGPVLPPTCYVDAGNMVRTAAGAIVGRLVNGEFVANPSDAEHEEALAAKLAAARREREQEAEAEKARKFWVDPSGYRRSLEGRNLGRDSDLRAAEAAA